MSRQAPAPFSERLTRASWMLGTGVVSAIGQLVVNMPSGYFGPTDQLTTTGVIYAGSMLLGATLSALGAVLAWSRTRWFFVAITSLGLAFFLPALPSDPVVGGIIVAWQLAIMGGEFGHHARAHGWHGLQPELPFRPAALHLLLVSLLVTIMVVGFELTTLFVGQIACIAISALAILAAVSALWSLRSARAWSLLTSLAVAFTAVTNDLFLLIAALGIMQVGLVLIALSRGPLFSELLQHFLRRAGLQVLLAFASVALLGGIVLTFPASTDHTPISVLDALFTAVSATCVTGLIVLDTPTAFSPLGEAVILLLIQVGGLGIMVLSAFATLMLGQRLTLRHEHALEQALDITVPMHAYRLVRFIVLGTLAVESVGAALLAFFYSQHGLPLADAIWRGVFHSVSAFCNAGFALQSDSLIMFQSDPVPLLVHAVLIILGGLGFAVVAWLFRRCFIHPSERASVQVKLVLVLSFSFVLIGSLLYAILEWNASLDHLSATDKISNALFQSVTMRTAGFNSVDFSALRPATVLFTMSFMFIGAAPGGTGGGIKITTFAVLMASLATAVGANRRPTVFGRAIPAATVLRAAAIATMTLCIGMSALFLLLLTDDAEFIPLSFEVVSALGTVGLSLGITSDLSNAGKAIIIATMFIGRVGPLTVALAFSGGTKPMLDHPETTVMVG